MSAGAEDVLEVQAKEENHNCGGVCPCSVSGCTVHCLALSLAVLYIVSLLLYSLILSCCIAVLYIVSLCLLLYSTFSFSLVVLVVVVFSLWLCSQL